MDLGVVYDFSLRQNSVHISFNLIIAFFSLHILADNITHIPQRLFL